MKASKIFKIRDPKTGLLFTTPYGRQGGFEEYWDEVGTVYRSAALARDSFHSVIMGFDIDPPHVEIVEFEFAERNVTQYRLPSLKMLRRFLNRAGLGSYSGLGKFALNVAARGENPRYLVVIKGTHKPTSHLNLKGSARANSGFGAGGTTYVAAPDDETLIALKLAHQDDIEAVWNYREGVKVSY